MMKKICIILGTRPEIIKMSPIIHELDRRGADYFIIHTGQHYTPNMDELFFKELALPKPKYNLGLGGIAKHQLGLFIEGITKVLESEKPDAVLVEGDTNSVVAGAIAARRLDIPIGHVEAGLRSFDMAMPEEVNRIITDHLSSWLFAPTKIAEQYIRESGIPDERSFMVGNTIADAVLRYRSKIDDMLSQLESIGLRSKKFVLITVHRAENTNDRQRLENIFSALDRLAREFSDLVFVLPLHPRTRKKCAEFGIEISAAIKIIEPVGFFTMLMLEREARLIITDSGGVQEEASILGTPAVTIRDNTERPETVEAGHNMLASPNDIEAILKAAREMAGKNISSVNLYGNGDASRRIIDILLADT